MHHRSAALTGELPHGAAAVLALLRALARAAETPLEAALYITAAFTGLRWNELRQLRWEDISWSKALIHVRHETKSHLARSLPMIDRVARELDSLSRARVYECELVFPNEVGRPLDHSKTNKRFKAALRRAGLKQIRFHDLRHTFGTLAVRAPHTTLKDVQAWMGHADIQTTMIYVHHTPQHNAAANLGQAMTAVVPSEVPLTRPEPSHKDAQDPREPAS